MTERPFSGFPGQVWTTCYQALVWLDNLLDNNTAQTVANPVLCTYQLLRQGSMSIAAWQAGVGLAQEVVNLTTVQSLPITLDPTTQSYFNTRIATISLAAQGIAALQPKPNPITVVSQLNAGNSTMLNSGYLEFCMAFTGEPTPVGLTPATLGSYASTVANVWLTVMNAISAYQGAMPTSAYDTASRMYRSASVVANTINQFQSGPFARANINDWNSLIALPSVLLDAMTIATSPALLQAQQANTIRYILDTTADSLAVFLTVIQTTVSAQATTANLSNTNTLQDLAARQTGNFENWTTIASDNNLLPPFPGPTNQAVALSGQQLYMPGSGVQIGANQTPPSYPDSVMGTDINFGPLDGPQLAWAGELPVIKGLLNLNAAIGRRLQTPLGSLIYHTNYGSRIPAEVGAVQSENEAAKLGAFGSQAILADPRVARIISMIATVQPGFLATFAATIQPIGPGSSPLKLTQSVTPLN